MVLECPAITAIAGHFLFWRLIWQLPNIQQYRAAYSFGGMAAVSELLQNLKHCIGAMEDRMRSHNGLQIFEHGEDLPDSTVPVDRSLPPSRYGYKLADESGVQRWVAGTESDFQRVSAALGDLADDTHTFSCEQLSPTVCGMSGCSAITACRMVYDAAGKYYVCRCVKL
ncbi:hypothetical protein ACA040_004319 [Xenophilus aerolatus]